MGPPPPDPSPASLPETHKTKPRGALIVFEGLDRAGKSTQHRLVLESLVAESVDGTARRKVEGMRFPDRTTRIGKLIDEYLKGESEVEDHVVHLLFSANRWEVAAKIEALLKAGTTILLDRYYHSGMIYSAAKRNPLLPLSWALGPDIGLPRPDLVVFLDISAEKAAERAGFGGERYEEGTMQARVRELFGIVGSEEEAGGLWRRVDGGRAVEEVQAEVGALVRRCIADVEGDGRLLLRVER